MRGEFDSSRPARWPVRGPSHGGEHGPTLEMEPEYGCSPLWLEEPPEISLPVSVFALPVSPALAAELDAWDERYQQTLDQGYPPDSAFPSHEDERAWVDEGARLYARLVQEVGDRFQMEPEWSGRYPWFRRA